MCAVVEIMHRPNGDQITVADVDEIGTRAQTGKRYGAVLAVKLPVAYDLRPTDRAGAKLNENVFALFGDLRRQLDLKVDCVDRGAGERSGGTHQRRGRRAGARHERSEYSPATTRVVHWLKPPKVHDSCTARESESSAFRPKRQGRLRARRATASVLLGGRRLIKPYTYRASTEGYGA